MAEGQLPLLTDQWGTKAFVVIPRELFKVLQDRMKFKD